MTAGPAEWSISLVLKLRTSEFCATLLWLYQKVKAIFWKAWHGMTIPRRSGRDISAVDAQFALVVSWNLLCCTFFCNCFFATCLLANMLWSRWFKSWPFDSRIVGSQIFLMVTFSPSQKGHQLKCQVYTIYHKIHVCCIYLHLFLVEPQPKHNPNAMNVEFLSQCHRMLQKNIWLARETKKYHPPPLLKKNPTLVTYCLGRFGRFSCWFVCFSK